MAVDSSQFLGLASCGLDRADALILPLPMEKTVSYGTGTEGGPRAILDASPQIELFEEETLLDFAKFPRIHTLPPVVPGPTLTADNVTDYLDEVRRRVETLRGKFVLALGGEHLVTYGMVTGLVDDPAEVTIVHIDAHGDMADELGGRRWSHGTVMRRLWERGSQFVQIGIRSVSRPEYELIRTGPRIDTYYAHQLADRWDELLDKIRNLKGKVYLSLDVDGLDPSIIPSTGTPQPGGLDWQQTMDVLRVLAGAPSAEWIGGDVVEFVASPTPPGCDFTAARLVMKVLAWWATHKSSCD